MSTTSADGDRHRGTVFVVDDDRSIRKALTRLLRSAGLKVESFSNAMDFLASERHDHPAALLLDIQMPGLSGLELQQKLRDRDPAIVFITGHGTVPRSVQAMKMGAVDFLQKPFEDKDLLTAIRQALDDPNFDGSLLAPSNGKQLRACCLELGQDDSGMVTKPPAVLGQYGAILAPNEELQFHFLLEF